MREITSRLSTLLLSQRSTHGDWLVAGASKAERTTSTRMAAQDTWLQSTSSVSGSNTLGPEGKGRPLDSHSAISMSPGKRGAPGAARRFGVVLWVWLKHTHCCSVSVRPRRMRAVCEFWLLQNVSAEWRNCDGGKTGKSSERFP